MTPESEKAYDALLAAVSALVESDGKNTDLASEMIRGQNGNEVAALALHTIHALVELAAAASSADPVPIDTPRLWAYYCTRVQAERVPG